MEMLNTGVNSKAHVGSNLQRKKILTLIGLFFATLPISYVINAFTRFGLPISDALCHLGVYWVLAADIAYLSSTILTSFFFTFIAWLFLIVEKM